MLRVRRSVAGALTAAALLAAPPAALAAQQAVAGGDARPLSPARVAAQVTAGTLATPIGFVAVGVLTDTFLERTGNDGDLGSQIALGAAYAGGALGAAAGPALVGARGPGRGSYWAAVGGAAAGGLASWGLVRLVDRDGGEPSRGGRIVAAVAGAAVFMLPSVGATVAYNLSRRP
jgi:hypothetical protein